VLHAQADWLTQGSKHVLAREAPMLCLANRALCAAARLHEG